MNVRPRRRAPAPQPFLPTDKTESVNRNPKSRYRIDMLNGPARRLRLRSMYAENESDTLLFQPSEGAKAGLELVHTPLVLQYMDKVYV